MKQDNDYHGGRNALSFEPTVLHTYARYLEKYVLAYQQAGVPVYAVHVQNEPASEQVFPSCPWTGPQERDFVRDYLGPLFRADHVPAQIWLGTINDGNVGDYAVPVLSDPQAAQYITGVGYQWAGKDAIGPTHDKYPAYKLMQTETECGGGENNWDSATHTWGLLRHYLTHWANSYMYWNMVLDQNSVSSWGWQQNAMVTVHTDTRTVTYNPEFYMMKHFSAFIAPGAKRIGATGRDDVLAFRNPDGALVVEAANLTDAPGPGHAALRRQAPRGVPARPVLQHVRLPIHSGEKRPMKNASMHPLACATLLCMYVLTGVGACAQGFHQVPYHVDAPMYPHDYTGAQTAAQDQRGAALLQDIQDKMKAGAASYTVVPGVYRLAPDRSP